MSEDKSYTAQFGSNSSGSIGNTIIDVRLSHTGVSKEMIADCQNIRLAYYDFEKTIKNELTALALENSGRAQAIKETNEKLLELFEQPIFSEEIPNRYYGKDDAYGRFKCWYRVTTSIGHFVIGWRKRVISIDWNDTVGTKTTQELFSKESVTKGDKLIHAWSMEKAKEYIETILGGAS